MLKQLRDITLRMVAGANIATIVLLLLAGYSDRLNPVDHPVLANAGLVFPVLLAMNVAFMAFWVIFRWRRAFIPFVGLVFCYTPVHTYLPLNLSKEPVGQTIKVLSYNVWGFGSWDSAAGYTPPILDYLRRQNADIVCLQEAMPREVGRKRVDAVMDSLYQYCDTAMKTSSGDCLALYSKYPIVSRHRIRYASQGNLSMACEVKIGQDTVIVINNHFETTGLSLEDRSRFSRMVKGKMQTDAAGRESRRLVDKLGEASQKRAPQADAVARYISEHSGRSFIVCGDFNDSPISYTRRTVAAHLNDCYVESGFGPGISYHRSGFYVRIDNILCSDDWVPYNCRVDSEIKSSDHYPISCLLKKK